MIPAYFIRLMADGKKLRKKLIKPRFAFGGEVHQGEELLITSDFAMWTAPPFGKVTMARSGHSVQFHPPNVERPGTTPDFR